MSFKLLMKLAIRLEHERLSVQHYSPICNMKILDRTLEHDQKWNKNYKLKSVWDIEKQPF